jgi:hypothetical protein
MIGIMLQRNGDAQMTGRQIVLDRGVAGNQPPNARTSLDPEGRLSQPSPGKLESEWALVAGSAVDPMEIRDLRLRRQSDNACIPAVSSAAGAVCRERPEAPAASD